MEHQYPGAISGDEHMLAELMLPDQAHVRNQDWTIFFLHKDTSGDEENGEDPENKPPPRRRKKRRAQSDGEQPNDDGDVEDAEESGSEADDEEGKGDNEGEEDEDEEAEGGEGPPLIYVLNLVNTKQDNTAKRSVPIQYPSTWASRLTLI